MHYIDKPLLFGLCANGSPKGHSKFTGFSVENIAWNSNDHEIEVDAAMLKRLIQVLFEIFSDKIIQSSRHRVPVSRLLSHRG